MSKKRKKLDPINTWFTSDTHFSHKAISQFTDRWAIFKDDPSAGKVMKEDMTDEKMEEMDQLLIDRWNSVVGVDHNVYHLGDFKFGSRKNQNELAHSLLDRLNGNIHFCIGNHDYSILSDDMVISRFASVSRIKMLNFIDPDVKTQQVVLCHFPMRSWESMHYGTWHLHGHCHGTLQDDWGTPMNLSSNSGKMMDVGIDGDHNKARPISYEEVKKYMSIRAITSCDHHNEDCG